MSVVCQIVATRSSGPPASGKIIKEMPGSVASGTPYIITASGIVTLCKRLYGMPDESRLSSGILYSRLQRVTIPVAVIIPEDGHVNARNMSRIVM